MAAWWQFRHPLCFCPVASRVRRLFTFLRLSVRSLFRLTVDIRLHRVHVREGSRVSRSGEAQGRLARGPVVFLRNPLRSGAHRRVAVATPVGSRRLERDSRRVDLRADRPAVRGRAWRHQPGGSGGLRAAQRGLSVAQHLDARVAGVTDGGARTRPPGDGLHTRGWFHFGERVGVPVPGRGVGAQRRRRGRDHQLPARRAGLPGSPGSGRSRRAGRELGHTGSTECLAMGARQHRGLWRRSGRRHHLRGVRRRVQRGDAARDACRQRPLPARHRAERGCACARAVRRGTVGRASGVCLGHRVAAPGSCSSTSPRPSLWPPPKSSGSAVRIRA